MRPLEQLIETREPAWPIVQEWIAEARNRVEVLPPREPDRGDALVALQITTRSAMGAVIYESGGLLVDDGWLRILGSGNPKLPRSLPHWNQGRNQAAPGGLPPFLLVADDVVGGFFAINGGHFGEDRGNIYYFAPDTLEWESLERGYSDFLTWCFEGDLEEFYADYRWPSWRDEVRTLAGDRAYSIYPFPCTDGPPYSQRSRRPVPLDELFRLHVGGGLLGK
jgi:hypothetical protein